VNRAESTKGVIKLVDACNQTSRRFAHEGANASNPAIRQFAGNVAEKLDQFKFELETEMRRLGGGHPTPSRTEEKQHSAEMALRCTLDDYRGALNLPVSAHARAMIKRQYSELQKAYEQLIALLAA
jgi:hypothetical protein